MSPMFIIKIVLTITVLALVISVFRQNDGTSKKYDKYMIYLLGFELVIMIVAKFVW
ncbi:hypothetical protein SFC65_19545 [Priestia filamentosa]|uniref:hypothetical protein n=1 Tax=Priestia filamentosa TaxID=1402861 RepID=UPI003981AC36